MAPLRRVLFGLVASGFLSAASAVSVPLPDVCVTGACDDDDVSMFQKQGSIKMKKSKVMKEPTEADLLAEEPEEDASEPDGSSVSIPLRSERSSEMKQKR